MKWWDQYYSTGIDFKYQRRQILTSKDDPHTERMKIFIDLNIGMNMKELANMKELPKTFMMISNEKPLVSMVHTQIFQRCKGQTCVSGGIGIC